MFMGLDQSFTSTGYCVFRDDMTMKTCDVIQTEKDQFPTQFERQIFIVDSMMKVIRENAITRVHLEGLAFSKLGNVTRDLGGLQYLIVQELIRNGIEYTITPPTTVKKCQTGSGKQKKEELFDALPKNISEKIGTFLKTKGRYDITDSYWIAIAGENTINGSTEIGKKQ